jgi:hypothetical protein
LASSRRIDFTINGHNNAKQALNAAANDVKQFANNVKTAFSNIQIKPALDRIVSSTRTAVDQMKTFFNSLGGVLTSVFAGFSFESIVEKAASSQAKWLRIAAETGKSMEQQKNTIRSIADTYGVVYGELSGIYETSVRFWGSEQKGLDITKGIAATQKRTGTDMVTIQQALISGELGRNKTLQRNVLTEEQRLRYLKDGKITEEEIQQIMQENIAYVEAHKELTQDTESAYARMKTSIDKIMVTIGTDLAPILENAANTVATIGDLFTKADKATGGVLGGVTGILLGLTAVGAPLIFIAGQMVKIAASAWSYAAGMRAGAGAGVPTTVTLPGGKTIPTGTGGQPTSTAGKITGGLGAIGGALGIASLGGAAVAGGLGVLSAGLVWGMSQLKPNERTMSSKANYGLIGGANPTYDTGGNVIEKPNTGIKWPSAGEIGGWIRERIPKFDWKWPSLGSIGAWIQSKISWLKFPTISWGSVSDWVRSKIGWLSFPTISWGSIAQWIQDKIPWLRWPSGPGGFISGAIGTARSVYNSVQSAATNVYSTVSNAVGGAVNWVSSAASNAWNWLTSRGPGDVRYENYAGVKHNPWMSDGTLSGNCMDMSLGMISAAGEGELQFTTWNGGPHAYARIRGRDYDPARFALEGTWSPPARGPGDSSQNTIVLYGDVYGFDDFAKRVEQATNKKISRVF